MTNLVSWTSHLRTLRKRTDLTQGQLIEKLSIVVSELTEEDVAGLNRAGLYEEVSTYLGGILDTPALSKLETGRREIGSRKRCLALIWGFRELGVLNDPIDANQFLQSGEFGNLTDTELEAIFGMVGSGLGNGSAESASPLSRSPSVSSNAPQSNKRIPMLLLGLLAVTLLGLGYWQLNRGSSSNATVFDNFSADEFDPEVWDTTNAPHALIEKGHLLLDVPVNDTEGWASERLEPYDSVGVISSLSYTFAIETPDVYTPGAIGVTTGCINDAGWINTYAGGEPARLFIEYSQIEDVVDWENDLIVIDVMEIELGRAYDIDLVWTGEEVELSVDGRLQEQILIECNTTGYFNISTSTNPGEKVRGLIDQIQVNYQ